MVTSEPAGEDHLSNNIGDASMLVDQALEQMLTFAKAPHDPCRKLRRVVSDTIDSLSDCEENMTKPTPLPDQRGQEQLPTQDRLSSATATRNVCVLRIRHYLKCWP